MLTNSLPTSNDSMLALSGGTSVIASFAGTAGKADKFARHHLNISDQRTAVDEGLNGRLANGSSAIDGGPVASVLVDLLSSAESALERDNGKARQLITTAAAILTAELDARRDAAMGCSTPSAKHSALAPWQKKRVLQHIDDNLDGPISVEDLARVCRISTSYFSKAFRADFGRSPHAYVVDRRIRRAQQLMLTTDKPLANIAIVCGLSDHAHLTRLFRRAVGESPASWRKQRNRPQTMREPQSASGQLLVA
jgi:AraC family transcriptional regulator